MKSHVLILAAGSALVACSAFSASAGNARTTAAASSSGQSASTAPPSGFNACAACHKTKPGEASFAGPNLAGIKGRKAGTAPGFRYSAAMAKSDVIWDKKALTAFLADPKKTVPGTRMAYPGINDPKKAEAFADYLLTL